MALLALVLPLPSPAGAAVELTPLITGLAAPIAFVDPPDGEPHRFVAQQAGEIVVWDGTPGPPLPTPFLDLSDEAPPSQRKVEFLGERGLLSMAFHPDYATNGWFFVLYTSTDWDGPGGIQLGDVVIERYTRSAVDADLADPGSALLVLVVPHSSAGNHNGGDLRFGRDGYLYATLGDGGGGCDNVAHSAQDPNQLLGKMLRLDVDGADAFPANPLRHYAIPADNPLVGFAGADEIWAMGLRNPFRFTFDRANGDIYIGDVGQDDWEEIDLLPAGAVTAGAPANFGWPCLEGFVDSECADPPQGCGASFIDPVRVEPNSGGTWNAIIGGFFYRGSRLTGSLGRRIVYGDASNGEIWAAVPAVTGPPGWPSVQLADGSAPYAFGEDQWGELYVLWAGFGRVDCLHATGDDCTRWASDGDVFLDDFEDGDTGAWSSEVP